MSANDSSMRETNYAAVASYTSLRGDTYPFIDTAKADLSGKSVLITGASRGFGRATAISFAKAGCSKILIAARSDLSEVEAAVREAARAANRQEPLVRALNVDVASQDSVRAALETASEILGGSLDVLINNAGVLGGWEPIIDSDPSEWWQAWEVNVKGVYLMMHYFTPLVLKSSLKTILNISSAGGHLLSDGASSYQTAKFALGRLTEFIDKEHHQQGLIAISVHPGGMVTDMTAQLPSDIQVWFTDTPELAGDTLVWLSGRRDWLSGRFVTATWDMEELERKKEDIFDRNLFKFRAVV